ncbi:MAG TPA: cytochrome P450 [Pseudonocardia sp.]
MTAAPSPAPSAASSPAPSSDVDLFTEDVLLDPYPHYATLRDQGPAVWLTASSMWAIPRYHDMRTVLADWATYSSAQGIAIDPGFSAVLKGAFIACDPPEHRPQRQVLADRLTVPALRSLKDQIQAWATDHVDACLADTTFDAVTGLARPYPLHVIGSLLGLPRVPAGLADWASAAFQSLGPANERALGVVHLLGELEAFLSAEAGPESVPSGSFGADIHDAARRGAVTATQAASILRAYATAGIDTTVNALSSALWLLARHPAQWQMLRADPARIPAAFEEALRMESPVQAFARSVTRDHDLGEVSLAAGDRVMLLYGSANRDPRRWSEPDRFDITRSARGHLAFGHGIHVCPGAHLARFEAIAVLTAMARRVDRLELADAPTRQVNNTVRGFTSLPLTVRLAA